MEAAGLALAVFSASINCLDGYRKIKDMKEHHGSLKRFKRQLNMENCKFTNTCRILLEGVVPAEHVKILVGGAGWKDPDFQARFEQHLGVETAIAFTGAVEDLHESLQRLSEEVGGLDEKQRSAIKKAKIALRKEKHVSLLAELTKINTDLAQLTAQQSRTTTPRALPRNSTAAEKYNRIRNHARSLHSVLQERFLSAICACQGPHNASLRLQRTMTDLKDRDEPRLKVIFDVESTPTRQRDWRTLEFEQVKQPATPTKVTELVVDNVMGPDLVVEDTPRLGHPQRERIVGVRESLANVGMLATLVGMGSRPRRGAGYIPGKSVTFESPILAERKNPSIPVLEISAKKIEDLCGAIGQTTNHTIDSYSDSCIGILVDEDNGLFHRIWPSSTVPVCCADAISLNDLLVPGLLEKTVRLNLGVQLASAVMQLHTSEWMTERWGKQDIFFLQRVRPCHAEDGKLTKIREPVADKPFVRRIFKSTTTQHTSPTTTALTELVRRDISLFSLGVVLVELWFERGIEELGSPRFDSSAPFNDNSIYETASQYIGELWRTAGENYSTAVSRCLHGLNRPMGTKSLESLEFKNAVHVDVVCLLEKNLEVYTNKQV